MQLDPTKELRKFLKIIRVGTKIFLMCLIKCLRAIDPFPICGSIGSGQRVQLITTNKKWVL